MLTKEQLNYLISKLDNKLIDIAESGNELHEHYCTQTHITYLTPKERYLHYLNELKYELVSMVQVHHYLTLQKSP